MISLKFSPHKKIPIIKENGIEHYFWNYPRHVWDFRKFKILEDKPDLVIVSYQDHVMKFPRYYWNVLHAEWGRIWTRDYLPKGGLKGKLAVDFGAGAGESTLFLLKSGARGVLAVEPDPVAFSYLQENMKGFSVRCKQEKFTAELLESIATDFVKLDVEGAESELLKIEELPPSISVEVHSLELLKALTEKFPQFRNLGKNEAGSWIVKYP